jgi:hypothetical protein
MGDDHNDNERASVEDPRRRSAPAVTCLKHYARILHRRARRGEPEALKRLRVLRELRDAEPAQIARTIQRRHCLTASAVNVGFRSWEHALSVLDENDDGDGGTKDFGTLLYPDSCFGHWNIWSADYEEARGIRETHGGYLLAYRRQFLIVDRHYIESLGLDPDDPDWDAIGRDWVKPHAREARARLDRTLVSNALTRLAG